MEFGEGVEQLVWNPDAPFLVFVLPIHSSLFVVSSLAGGGEGAVPCPVVTALSWIFTSSFR